MAGVPGKFAVRSKEASQVFRTAGHNFEARLASNANRTYLCDHHQGSENDAKPALQIRLSTSAWNAKTGGIKGCCGFINGCTQLSVPQVAEVTATIHPHKQLSMHSEPWLT